MRVGIESVMSDLHYLKNGSCRNMVQLDFFAIDFDNILDKAREKSSAKKTV